MRKHTIIIAFMAALLLSVSPMSLTEAQVLGNGENSQKTDSSSDKDYARKHRPSSYQQDAGSDTDEWESTELDDIMKEYKSKCKTTNYIFSRDREGVLEECTDLKLWEYGALNAPDEMTREEAYDWAYKNHYDDVKEEMKKKFNTGTREFSKANTSTESKTETATESKTEAEPESKTETKETSDQHGKTTTTTTTGSGTPSGSGASGDSGSADGSGSAGDSGTEVSGGSASGSSADKDKKDDANKKDETQYTGVFNERQIVPNTMAIYCKVNAEDMLKENAKLYNCINDIARKINDSDASIRAENMQRFDEIRYEELKTMMAQAIAKGAAISNYENIQNELGDATGKTKTEHEDNVAIASATSTLTDVINTMRDLYAERLKNEAITGIQSIDPKVIKDIAEQESEAANGDKSKGEDAGTGTAKDGKKNQETTSTSIQVTENKPDIDVTWKEGNNCSQTVCTGGDNGTCHEEVIPCPNNIYPINGSAGTYMVCINGECQKYEDDNFCDNGSLKEQSGTITDPSTGMCGDSKCPMGIYNFGGGKYACYDDVCTTCDTGAVITPDK